MSFSARLEAHPLLADNPLVKVYTINDGLSQNMIFSVAQDSVGFMWFGTKEGINRFDGHSFKTYRAGIPGRVGGSGLTGNYIPFSGTDSEGRLWVQSIPGGLHYFDHNLQQFNLATALVPVDNQVVSHVMQRIVGNSMSGWLIESRGLVLYMNPTDFTLTTLVKDENDPLPAEKMDERMRSLVRKYTTESGPLIHALHPKYGRWTDTYPETGTIGTAIRDDAGRLWIGTSRGLWLAPDDHTAPKLVPFLSNPENVHPMVMRMDMDKDDRLWVQTHDYIVQVDVNTATVLSVEQFPRISSSGLDRGGIFWAGLSGFGVVQLDPVRSRFGLSTTLYSQYLVPDFSNQLIHHLENPLYVNLRMVTTIQPDIHSENNYWIGTYYAGVYRYDKAKNKITYAIDNLQEEAWLNNVNGIYQDGNYLWIGSNTYVTRYDLETGSYQKFALFEQEYIIRDLAMVIRERSSAVFKDAHGYMWVGTSFAGLRRLDPVTGELRVLSTDAGSDAPISGNHILSIHEDPLQPDRYIWVGTDGFGLNRVDLQTLESKHFSVENGLPNNVIYGILSDNDGHLWMSSNNGLIRMNTRTFEFTNFQVSSGLQSNEFNRFQYMKRRNGRLVFCGPYGCNEFDPAAIQLRTYAPNVVFTRLRVMNEDITNNIPMDMLWSGGKEPGRLKRAEGIRIPWFRNVFSLDFAALDFAAPDKNQYRYTLTGFDDDWVEGGTQRSLSYTNLNPGRYTLRLQATNSDGIWSPREARLEIEIVPPWWQTAWFRGMALLFGAVFIGLTTWGVSRWKHMREMRELRYRMQLDAEKLRISRDMHDSIGARLTQINLLTESMQHQPEGWKDRMGSLSFATKDVIRQCSEIVWSLNPENDTLESLGDYIVQYSTGFVRSAGKQLRLDADELPQNPLRSEVRHNIVMVLKEALNNAVKYSGSEVILVEIKYSPEAFMLTVRDYGRGLPENISDYLNIDTLGGQGMRTMKHRADELGGTLEIKSSPNDGVSVCLSIPLR